MHLLAVVEDEQQTAAARVLGHRARERLARPAAHAERGGRRAHDALGVVRRREVHEPHAVREAAEHLASHLQREARLADAAGADQGHESRAGEHRLRPLDLGRAADERRAGGRQVVRRRSGGRGLEGGERFGEVRHGGVARARGLLERPQHDAVERVGKIQPARARRRGRRGDVVDEETRDRRRDERAAPRQQLVEDAPERVDVRRPVEPLADALLGGHVARRAAADVVGLGRHGALVGQDLRHAEVEQLRRHPRGRVDEQHVLGLEVAVQDAGLVDRVQPRADGANQAHRFVGRHRLSRAKLLAQRPPVDQLHHQVRAGARGDAEVVDLDEVRMAQLRRQPRLVAQAVDVRRRRQAIGPQDLDGDLAREGQLGRAVDDTHPAAPDERVDPVLVVEDRSDHCAQAAPNCLHDTRRRVDGFFAVTFATATAKRSKSIAGGRSGERSEPRRPPERVARPDRP